MRRASALLSKQIFPNVDNHADASQARFHSRHNRIKGDRRQPSLCDAGSDSTSGEAGNVEPSAQFSDGDASDRLLHGGIGAGAGENLEAGKSPSQIFAGTCNACHKSPRGLLKTVPASSLPGFLRQHYTTSSDMASVLSSFLVSNGATDTRYQAKDQPKDSKARPRTPGRRRSPKASRTSSIALAAGCIPPHRCKRR